MVKTLLYLLSEGLVLLCVGLIPKSRKQLYTHHEDVFLEEFISNMWLRPLCASFKVYTLRAGGTDLWSIDVYAAGKSLGDSLNLKA